MDLIQMIGKTECSAKTEAIVCSVAVFYVSTTGGSVSITGKLVQGQKKERTVFSGRFMETANQNVPHTTLCLTPVFRY